MNMRPGIFFAIFPNDLSQQIKPAGSYECKQLRGQIEENGKQNIEITSRDSIGDGIHCVPKKGSNTRKEKKAFLSLL